MRITQATRDVLAIHQAAGRRFTAGGVRSFVREQGRGDAAIVCLHGVPTSSFLYRKVLAALAREDLRGVAFDLPGLGLAERPEGFDYSWSGLAAWVGEAIDSLGIGRCHLVVHDIGGPIGLEWAVRNPDRVLSVTVLDTMLELSTFRRPWTMHPFSIRGVGELWLRGMPRFLFTELFYLQGVANRSAVSRPEVHAHFALLKRVDGGRAFLEIMRGFELTEEKQRFLWEGLAERRYPARIVWGEHDPVLGMQHLRVAQEVLRVQDPIRLPARHLLQEDQPQAIAQAVADLAAPLG